MSDAELKEEIIKDLTERKAKRESQKRIKRNVSSQMSIPIEQRRMTNAHGQRNNPISSHFSEQSCKNMREVTNMTEQMMKINSQIEEKGANFLRNKLDQSPLAKGVHDRNTPQKMVAVSQSRKQQDKGKRNESLRNSQKQPENIQLNLKPPIARGTSGVLNSVQNNLAQHQKSRGKKGRDNSNVPRPNAGKDVSEFKQQ